MGQKSLVQTTSRRIVRTSFGWRRKQETVLSRESATYVSTRDTNLARKGRVGIEAVHVMRSTYDGVNRTLGRVPHIWSIADKMDHSLR